MPLLLLLERRAIFVSEEAFFFAKLGIVTFTSNEKSVVLLGVATR